MVKFKTLSYRSCDFYNYYNFGSANTLPFLLRSGSLVSFTIPSCCFPGLNYYLWTLKNCNFFVIFSLPAPTTNQHMKCRYILCVWVFHFYIQLVFSSLAIIQRKFPQNFDNINQQNLAILSGKKNLLFQLYLTFTPRVSNIEFRVWLQTWHISVLG